MEWKVHPSLLTLQTSSVKPSPSPHLNTHTSYPTSEPFHPKEGTVRHQSQPLKPLTNSSSSTFSHRTSTLQLSIPKEWGHHAISITQHSIKSGKDTPSATDTCFPQSSCRARISPSSWWFVHLIPRSVWQAPLRSCYSLFRRTTAYTALNPFPSS